MLFDAGKATCKYVWLFVLLRFGRGQEIFNKSEIRCRPLNSLSRIAHCSPFNESTYCDLPALPNTQALLSCRAGYRADVIFTTPEKYIVNCNEDGEWQPKPFSCSPVCGLAAIQPKPLVIDKSDATIGNLPWHASLYVEKISFGEPVKLLQCVATIIRNNLLITAAHCVYNKTTNTTIGPEKLFVMTGNIFHDYNHRSHDPEIVVKRAVKQVFVTSNYHGLAGLYDSDIALLELQEPYVFSGNFLPACLDTSGHSAQLLVSGVSGKTVSFGTVDGGWHLDNVRETVMVPYVPYEKCKGSNSVFTDGVVITMDKFCGGTTVCQHEGGGGLVFQVNDAWYVMGILSAGLAIHLNITEGKCNRNTGNVYTKVSDYMPWILEIISSLEQNDSGSSVTSNPESLTSITSRSSLVGSTNCLVPPQPANGQWKLDRAYCESFPIDRECDVPQGIELPPGNLIVYTCNAGYKASGNTDVYCGGRGNWGSLPECIEIKCESLNSASTTAKCFRLGQWVSCDSPILQGTRAKVSCRPGYTRAMSSRTMQSETVECNTDQKWEPDPIKCVPVCGRVISETTGGFPWYASIYRQYSDESGMFFQCGATVIRNNLILTAAACVYEKKTRSTVDPERLFVMAGHRFQNWDHPAHDPKLVQRSPVKEIHLNCNYRWRFSVADIALVEIKEPFQFSSSLLPACLHDYSHGQEVLEPDAWGSITEFGMTTVANCTIADEILSMKTVPYVPYNQCKISDKIIDKELLTSDKFCAGYHNRSRVCVHDRGGGLMLKKNDSWYIMGIVTRRSDLLTFAVEKTCEKYAIYTNVSQYTAWIRDVLFNLDQYKSNPPCSPAGSLDNGTTTLQIPLNNKPSSNDKDYACSAPPQPVNGEWRFHQSLCLDKADCEILRDAPLKPGTHLIYSCAPGYMAKGRTDVYCEFNGNWSAIPLCTEINCDSPHSVSTIALCYDQSGDSVNCVSSAPPGTIADISCQPGYERNTDFSAFQRKTVKCSEKGKWIPDPIRCVPVCGVAVTHQKPYIVNGTSARLSDFPWHATLYVQKNSSNEIRKDFICGATIIHANFLLTAAHCIYDETTKKTTDPKKLFVMTGNIFRDYDSPFHNLLSVRKTAVKNVYRPCRYYGLSGNYASDIALLESQTPFQFSSILLPACLDIDGYGDHILEPGVYGKVAGFGRTETGESSGVLQTLSLPYISYSECKTSKNDDKNVVFISKDKFCAGYTNGSAVCEGDSGGGMVFRRNDLWYALGIVSVGLGVDIDNGEKTCDRNSYSLYTKVSEHMTWIRDVMFPREQGNMYPPCIDH